jgi:hypothetical protein
LGFTSGELLDHMKNLKTLLQLVKSVTVLDSVSWQQVRWSKAWEEKGEVTNYQEALAVISHIN